MSHDSMFMADPIFYNGDKWAAEQEHENLIRYEDSFMPNGDRICSGCEKVDKPENMKDFIQDGFTFKVCRECAPCLLS